MGSAKGAGRAKHQQAVLALPSSSPGSIWLLDWVRAPSMSGEPRTVSKVGSSTEAPLIMNPPDPNRLTRSYIDGAAVLDTVLEEVPEPALRWRPEPGSWSVHEIVCRCADSETYAATRLGILLAETEPLIAGHDQVH